MCMYALREYRLLGLSRVGGISLFELHLRKELLVEPKTVKMLIFQFMILFLPANEHKAIHIHYVVFRAPHHKRWVLKTVCDH